MVWLIGGPFDGRHVSIARQTPFLKIGAALYRRLDDPDTGDPLDGYCIVDGAP